MEMQMAMLATQTDCSGFDSNLRCAFHGKAMMGYHAMHRMIGSDGRDQYALLLLRSDCISNVQVERHQCPLSLAE